MKSFAHKYIETDTNYRDNGTEALAAEYEIEQEVHDRRFQAYSLRNEISLEPIDGVCNCSNVRNHLRANLHFFQEEGDRLRLQNDIFKLIFAARPNNREYLNNPIIARVRQIPRRILDCGCGDGSWVVDVANKIPSSEVSYKFRSEPVMCEADKNMKR